MDYSLTNSFKQKREEFKVSLRREKLERIFSVVRQSKINQNGSFQSEQPPNLLIVHSVPPFFLIFNRSSQIQTKLPQ